MGYLEHVEERRAADGRGDIQRQPPARTIIAETIRGDAAQISAVARGFVIGQKSAARKLGRDRWGEGGGTYRRSGAPPKAQSTSEEASARSESGGSATSASAEYPCPAHPDSPKPTSDQIDILYMSVMWM